MSAADCDEGRAFAGFLKMTEAISVKAQEYKNGI